MQIYFFLNAKKKILNKYPNISTTITREWPLIVSYLKEAPFFIEDVIYEDLCSRTQGLNLCSLDI